MFLVSKYIQNTVLRTIPGAKIQEGLERYYYYVGYYFERIIGTRTMQKLNIDFQ